MMHRVCSFLLITLLVCTTLTTVESLYNAAYSYAHSDSLREMTVLQAPWMKGDIVPEDSKQSITLTFALKQKNLDKLNELFWQVSDPKHKRYGAYASLQQLTDLVAPSQEHIDTVMNWLASSVPCGSSAQLINSKDWIKVVCTIAEANKLLGTKFYTYTHSVTGKIAFRAGESLNVPSHVDPLIDFVGGANTPLHEYHVRRPMIHWEALKSEAVKFTSAAVPAVVAGNGQATIYFKPVCFDGVTNNDTTNTPCTTHPPQATSFLFRVVNKVGSWDYQVPASSVHCGFDPNTNGTTCNTTIGQGALTNYISTRVQFQTTFSNSSVSGFSNFSNPFYPKEFVTPEFLKKLYNIPNSLTVVSNQSTVAVAEFLKQYYNPADLSRFFQLMGLPDVPVQTLIGPNNATDGSINGGEAQLDIQYLMAIAVRATTWFWSVAGNNEYNGEEPFVEWITAISGSDNPPLVHSISYADTEDSLPMNYTDRLNVEFQKLGLRGITLLFSSGDDGAASYLGRTNNTACNKAHPEFPGTSPYVTCVGATQLSLEYSPICTQTIRGLNVGCSVPRERVCSAATDGVITTGGGFSIYYNRPSYQDDAVNAYLNQNITFPPKTWFNVNGRGVPDISGYGNNYIVVMGNDLVPTSGTSASTPLLAAMITLWNDIRIRQGRPPMGFINPFLYQTAASTPEAFMDVTVGDNSCLVRGYPCCQYGFYASVGWDATTGLGTPRWDIIANLVANPNNQFPSVAAAVDGQDGKDAPLGMSIAAIVMAGVAVLLSVFSLFRRPRGDSDGFTRLNR